MSEDWAQSIWIAISLIVFVAVLVLALHYATLGKQIFNETEKQDYLDSVLEEYNEYQIFDNKTVYPQDVINAITKTQGEPYVKVKTVYANGTVQNLGWLRSTSMADLFGFAGYSVYQNYSIANVTQNLGEKFFEYMYLATLEKGTNGEIVGICFTYIPTT